MGRRGNRALPGAVPAIREIGLALGHLELASEKGLARSPVGWEGWGWASAILMHVLEQLNGRLSNGTHVALRAMQAITDRPQ